MIESMVIVGVGLVLFGLGCVICYWQGYWSGFGNAVLRGEASDDASRRLIHALEERVSSLATGESIRSDLAALCTRHGILMFVFNYIQEPEPLSLEKGKGLVVNGTHGSKIALCSREEQAQLGNALGEVYIQWLEKRGVMVSNPSVEDN